VDIPHFPSLRLCVFAPLREHFVLPFRSGAFSPCFPKKPPPPAKNAWERNMEIVATILACLAESAIGLLELVASFATCIYARDDTNDTRKKR
jgi:hypothetical protein